MKIRPPTELPKTKSKKLTVKVIDIKTEIPTQFKVGDIIAEIDSELVEKDTVIFGRGDTA